MFEKLRHAPALEKAVASFDQLPTRDRRALQLLGTVLAIFLLYFLIWRPAHLYAVESQRDLASAQDLVSWIHAHESEARALAGHGQKGTQVVDSRALLSTVTQSAQKAGLPLQRFEPSGENQMRVWLDNVPFTRVAGWLEQLASQYGIHVDQASIDRAQEPGLITARFTLQI